MVVMWKKEKQLKSDIGCIKNWVGKIEKISSYIKIKKRKEKGKS